jgi:hypothetical protein
MRTPILIFNLMLMAFVLGCEDSGLQPTTTDVVTSTGTILEKSAQFYVIESDVPNQYGVKTFYPVNLSDSFRHNGLRVLFSGKPEGDPATQYQYLPFRLSFIQSIQQ